jgi:taurine dioxygenase
MKNSGITLKPLSATTGVEISGVDLRQPLSEADAADIRAALNVWGVVFFREQELEPQHQLAFARTFGTVEVRTHPTSMGQVDGHPELAVIRREPTDGRNTGGFWHTDQCFLPDPPLGSVLYARQLPERGGDTMFAHMGAACAALSDGMRDMLRGLRAVHVRLNYHGIDGRAQWGVTADELAHYAEKYAGIEATHPVIGRHPESGQEILYLNPIYTDRFEGWTRDESQPLIQHLCARATRPENICRFHWEDGSLAMWDNRAVLHYALDDYPGETRVMQRCVVLGPWLQPPATATA